MTHPVASQPHFGDIREHGPYVGGRDGSVYSRREISHSSEDESVRREWFFVRACRFFFPFLRGGRGDQPSLELLSQTGFPDGRPFLGEGIIDEKLDFIRERLQDEEARALAMNRLPMGWRHNTRTRAVVSPDEIELSQEELDILFSRMHTDWFPGFFERKETPFSIMIGGRQYRSITIDQILGMPIEVLATSSEMRRFLFPSDELSRLVPRAPVIDMLQAEAIFSRYTLEGRKRSFCLAQLWDFCFLRPLGMRVVKEAVKGEGEHAYFIAYRVIPLDESDSMRWGDLCMRYPGYRRMITRALRNARLIPEFNYLGIYYDLVRSFWEGLRERAHRLEKVEERAIWKESVEEYWNPTAGALMLEPIQLEDRVCS